MKIKKFSQKDINEVLEIEQKLFPNPWKQEDFTFMILKSSYNFILKRENEIVGYFCSFLMDKTIHITNFAMLNEYQNKGIGYTFFKTVIDFLDGYEHSVFFLEVRNSNKKATHLYKKLGFKVVDIIKDYYHNPSEDALLMIKH